MTIAYFCIVIAIFIPVVCVAFAKFSAKGYDNGMPREFLEKVDGPRKRAHYAQMNSWEALTPFAAGVIVAHQLNAPQPLVHPEPKRVPYPTNNPAAIKARIDGLKVKVSFPG